MTVPLVRWATTPRIVANTWRRSAAYREYRQTIEVRSYAQLVTALERILADPALRTCAALDFAPGVDYARRFLNSTAAFRTRPSADPQRHLADRAVRLLVAILTGPVTRPGRHANPPLSGEQVATIQRTHDAWVLLVRKVWRFEDRLLAARSLLNERFVWSAGHRRALRALLLRAKTRPSDIAITLTAWEMRLPVRRVRAALRDTADALYA